MNMKNVVSEGLLRSQENVKRCSRKKYSVILADPAWPYKCWSKKGEGKSASRHYDVMSVDEIKALPVSQIAADDAVLFLWGTWPLLYETKEVIEAWGFTYKTKGFLWAKRNKKVKSWFMGMGYYTRANDEFCLLATRGRPLPRKSRSVRSFIESPIEAHSKKPDRIRDDIVELFGNVPRIELFARQQTPGWDCMGNEVQGGLDIRDTLEKMADEN